MHLLIRPALPADLPQVLALCRQLDLPGEPALSDRQAQAHFEALTAGDRHRIYVAEQQGQVVGTFALNFVGGLAHSARDSGIVEDVVVAPLLRGTGVGKKMMDFAMRECAARGCYKLVLSSHLQRDRAHSFYEGLGFRKHGFSFLIDPEAVDGAGQP
ncbi:GNAT family N-acetyltransferase [Rhizobacter sp. AJA081-3]|uniref:GNAT family N-acetyltransferase n=1 Tax=Rhizobacter sp. AJA081-3 TaxID=2753607 RepID=UPI001ADFF40F|nr:GNAT family N-acetyltransferase [Rhizobacter sp. AJA081-3]QTN23758.1 GNAT family N-acetyltransferase [Rhizobacter sp. AJA081-3]